MTDARRFTRQVRLAEVGEAGQAALGRAEVTPSGEGEVRALEARYLERAGVHVREDGPPTPADADERVAAMLDGLGITGDGAARDVAEASLRALVAMRAILGVDGA